MNYATALALPSWTAEIQGYSQTVIRYTPIIFKAFNKTLAPVIIASLKGTSLYLIQRERLWCQWAMTAAGITHNPIQSAVRSAHAELTSAEAQATYSRIRYITRETAMDALVLGLCGVVAVAISIETAQAVYRRAVALYGKAQARLKPASGIIPTVEIAFAEADDKANSAMVEEIQAERYFNAQFDQLDSDVQLIMEEQVDEAVAKLVIAQLKSARAALALQTEGDRLAREAMAFVVDHTVTFAMVEQQPVAPPENGQKREAKAKQQRKPRAQASTSTAVAKPTRAKVKAV